MHFEERLPFHPHSTAISFKNYEVKKSKVRNFFDDEVDGFVQLASKREKKRTHRVNDFLSSI